MTGVEPVSKICTYMKSSYTISGIYLLIKVGKENQTSKLRICITHNDLGHNSLMPPPPCFTLNKETYICYSLTSSIYLQNQDAVSDAIAISLIPVHRTKVRQQLWLTKQQTEPDELRCKLLLIRF